MSDLFVSGSRRNPYPAEPFYESDNTSGCNGPLLTAIPCGKRWRLKTLGSRATVELPAIFHNRLEALGACVLLAKQCGGRVIP
jgi:hypothetical protein